MILSKKIQKRYNELKQEEPDCLLLMQVGVFMQVMDDNARAVSEVTGLKLQMAGDIDAPVVLGGFPQSGLDAYIGRLVRAGHSVAIGYNRTDHVLTKCGKNRTLRNGTQVNRSECVPVR